MPLAESVTINGITILVADMAAKEGENAVARMCKMIVDKKLINRISEAVERVHAAACNQVLDPELLLNAAIYACTKTKPMTLDECMTAVEMRGSTLIDEYLTAK